ncbi:hypothetical protein FOZ63_021820 [Perkinsus olseni]|uniref:Uncharacterized protein n=1 Tax=Perkinsus olseni TaxID=32597 RepID=A0A7J6SLB2_PEROL|nr:hypothetical protein FOZ63_021820 [Perkinsus olseni]
MRALARGTHRDERENLSRIISFDTASDLTTVPEKVFSTIWDAIEAEFGPDHVDGTRKLTFHSKKEKKLLAYIDAKDWIWVRKRVTQQLPTIAVEADVEFTFEVLLTDHVRVCEGSWCRLLLVDGVKSYTSPHAFVLGRPFFVEHDLHVDYDAGIVGLRTPKGPVVNKLASVESWLKSRAPQCKRGGRHRSGVAGAFRRCIGKSTDD